MKKSFRAISQFTASFILLFLILVSSSANAQLTAWRYKDAIRIQEVSNTVKYNYQLPITVNTQALISLGRMNNAGNDIRIAKDCNGSVLYEYWIESGINTPNTKIWILIDTLAANGSRTVNMFYGNSAAPATSNFDNVFPPSTRLIVPAGSVTLNGMNNYSWFEIALGASVIITPNSPFGITARKIKINGTLDGNGAGYLGGQQGLNGNGPGGGKAGAAVTPANTSGGGGAYGGNGGRGNVAAGTNGDGGFAYGNTTTIDMGSGGGGPVGVGVGATEGNGGAGVTLIAREIEITGSVNLNGVVGTSGANVGWSAGGGAGGGLLLKAYQTFLPGFVNAKGGNGGSGNAGGGGGGGGRINLYSEIAFTPGTYSVAQGIRGNTTNTANPPALNGNPGVIFTGTYSALEPTVTILPHVAITAVNNPSCAGSNVTFTATTGYSTYRFYRNNVSVQNSASNTYSSTTLTNGNTIKVIAYYPVTGCADTSNIITMTINPLPVVTVSPTTATFCSGDSTTLTASGAVTFSWTPSGSLSAPTGATVTASPTITTTYTVTGTNSNGCSNTSMTTITVNPSPVLSTTATPTQICAGGTSQLDVTSSSATTGIVTLGTGTITNSSTGYPAPYGNYYWGARHQFLITAAELSAAGLVAGPISNLAFDVSSVNTAPMHMGFQVSMGATTLTSLTALQTGLTVVMTPANHQPVVGWNTHTFTTPFNWDGTSNVIIETCFNNSSYITNASVRQSSTSFTSTAYYRADASGVCGNNSLTNTSMQRPNMKLTGTLSLTYNWSPSVSLSNATIQNPVATPTATTTYSVVVTTASGCSSTSTITVTVDPIPVVSVTPSSPTLCIGGSDNLTASGATTYVWSPSSSLSSSTGTSVTANPTATTTYTVVGTSAAGCTNTTTVTVTVEPNPTVTVTPNSTSICNGGSTSLSAGGANTYAWSPSSSLNSSTGANVTANPTATTTYTVVGTSAAGCTNSSTVTITVDPSPTITVTPNSATICNGGSVSLTASGGNTYSWNTSATTNVISVSPTTTTTYTVVGTSTAGCTNTNTITVTVDPIPTITITPISAAICANSSANLSASGASTYVWAPSSSLNSSTGANVIATPSATTTYTVTGTSASGCTNTSTVTVTVNPIPVVSFTGLNSAYCLNDPSSTLIGSPSGGTFSGTGVSGNSFSPSAAGAGTFTITYSYTDGNGCSNTATQSTTVSNNAVVNLGPNINLCSTAQTTLNAGNFTTYSWSDGSTASTLVVDGTILGPGTYTYYVNVTNGNNCIGTDTIVVNVSICTGINDLANNMDINVYPNPTNGTFNISISNALGNKINLEIMSIEGQLVYSKESIKTTGEQIDISDLAKGVYFIKVIDENQVIVKKIILQ